MEATVWNEKPKNIYDWFIYYKHAAFLFNDGLGSCELFSSETIPLTGMKWDPFMWILNVVRQAVDVGEDYCHKINRKTKPNTVVR